MAQAANRAGNPLLKRKRSDVDESDPKLEEFLEVMRPNSKSKTWDTEETPAKGVDEPPRKVQAMELPEAESDSEYEIVPKKSIKKTAMPVQTASNFAAVPIAGEVETQYEPPQVDAGLDATDDDWLRSRTNRLLDLVDPTDAVILKPLNDGSQPSDREGKPIVLEEVVVDPDQEITAEEAVEEEVLSDGPDLTIEAIQASGRLFVRNLPYSATEDDLRKHFEVYGTLEEVNTFHRSLLLYIAS